jgi:hypothetical protein
MERKNFLVLPLDAPAVADVAGAVHDEGRDVKCYVPAEPIGRPANGSPSRLLQIRAQSTPSAVHLVLKTRIENTNGPS